MKKSVAMMMAFFMIWNMTALCFARDRDYYIYVEASEEETVEELPEEFASESVEWEVVIVPAEVTEEGEVSDSGHHEGIYYYAGDLPMDWDRLNKIVAAYSIDKADLTLMLDSAAERAVAAVQQRNIMTTPLTDYTVGEGLLAFVCVLLVIVCVLVPFTRGRRS